MAPAMNQLEAFRFWSGRIVAWKSLPEIRALKLPAVRALVVWCLRLRLIR